MNLSTGHTERGKIDHVRSPYAFLRGLFRPSRHDVWFRARTDYEATRRVYADASARQNCQAMRPARDRLVAAECALLRAEMALNPMPPMPRRGVSA